ncbi:MAG: hypothetical protein EBT98_03270 [Opitutaceae bacterium]|jgi:hypothetical protein|nr:hypothetical protein [Opitutaceae bacterium]NBR57691.1 hypothetical protein [Opitutaceae bacterium]
MNQNSWSDFTNAESLLAIGVALIMIGIILRGFVRSHRRTIALRHQHWLHTRQLGESEPTAPTTDGLERSLPLIANLSAIAGLVITLVSFFRK